MANTEADLTENVLLSHCWHKHLQSYYENLALPRNPNVVWQQQHLHLTVLAWGMPTFHAWCYPLSGRENRMDVISHVYTWKYWALQNFLKAKWIDKITQLTKWGARVRTHASDSKSRAFFSSLYCTVTYSRALSWEGAWGSSGWIIVAPPH